MGFDPNDAQDVPGLLVCDLNFSWQDIQCTFISGSEVVSLLSS
jgi:hypothetical protein